ncbi:MAG: hypothetical protein GSR86_04235 [Desulfurococcales archaeon]|nr:hypothetical protein [Desulfurococcales archaeon]
MLYSRIRLSELECRGLEEAQQLLQAYIDELLTGSPKPRGVLCTIPSRIEVLGLYTPYTGTATHRRITGGPPIAGEDLTYIGVTLLYPGLLKSLYREAVRAVQRAGGLVYGGEADLPGSRAVIGVTKMGGVGVVELLGSSRDALLEVLRGIYKVVDVAQVGLGEEVLRAAGGYRSGSWIRYPGPSAGLTARAGREGFSISMSARLHDQYLVDVAVTGNFYAAPPSEPFNLAARLEGTQLNELMFYQTKLAWRSRADVAGIEFEDVDSVMDELYTLLAGAPGNS